MSFFVSGDVFADKRATTYTPTSDTDCAGATAPFAKRGQSNTTGTKTGTVSTYGCLNVCDAGKKIKVTVDATTGASTYTCE
ncbi:MAG: hypothetical protein A2583_07235 [Bdellovibrionales bacterium RIFOXYD1_FULL_53_11]|nr:MAG: hypothetical protein A2583_07235 [Bdellovibrionales bacterium RIFOXYD1_FULL_53_11]